MRLLIVLVFIASISFNLGAQKRILHSTNEVPDLCILPAPEPGNVKRVSKPYRFSGNDRSLNYTITYVANGVTVAGKLCKTFPNNVKTALAYAASIWSDVLNSDQSLGIQACWTDSLGANTLGSAGPNNFYALSDTGAGLDAAYFPSALTE